MKKKKLYLWLPYLAALKVKPKTVFFQYKGGEEQIQWNKIHSIMLYGQTIDLPQVFLEKCAFYKIPVVIHRRHMPRAVIICPTLPPDKENILTQQILFRQNQKKKVYIARRLIQAKFKSSAWLFPLSRDLLYRVMRLENVLAIEAWAARRYWQKYFSQLGIEGRRRGDNRVRKILDAVSKFTSGILLRWILYHGLSPFHGFLHRPTDYPALVYDLMEPYRPYFEKVVFDLLQEAKQVEVEDSQLIGGAIERIKNLLEVKVYVAATRQVVTFHELLHGIVLALRSYLLGDSKRFIVPLPAVPNGGRPIKAGYKLYGHQAGKTDFWPQTRKIAQSFAAKFSPTAGLAEGDRDESSLIVSSK